MYNRLKNGLVALYAMSNLACGAQQVPSRAANNSGIEETVHRTHTEEVTTTTRQESEHEYTRQTRDGNTTTTDRRLSRTSNEHRLRTIEADEGDASASPRNLTVNLEGLLSGIRNGQLSRDNDNDNVFLNISFSSRGNNYLASLIDFADEMVSGIGDHVCDYFVVKVQRGNGRGDILRVNFSDIDNNLEFRQAARSASLVHYVPVGNITYRVTFDGGHGISGSFTAEDLMGLVDEAGMRFAPEYRVPQNN